MHLLFLGYCVTSEISFFFFQLHVENVFVYTAKLCVQLLYTQFYL